MENIITLDHGSGGKKTAQLIQEMILPYLKNDALSPLGDGAIINGSEKLVFSTDSFVVTPYFFPGGDIGKLAVCGTVNDVAMAGGEPKYLSLSLVIEEGLPVSHLEKILQSIGETAREAGVMIVTGDTKVVEKGKGDGIYINTSGIGFLRTPNLSPTNIRPGDKIILSGTAGNHGAAVMLARHTNLAEGEILSDCGLLNGPALALGKLGSDLRVMRDPTRGGAANALCEFAEDCNLCIELDEASIPVSPEVEGACELLGLDPLYCACEGRLLAVVAPERAEEALEILRRFPISENAAEIGEVTEAHPGRVVIRTAFGGSRIAGKLSGAQLPRIC